MQEVFRDQYLTVFRKDNIEVIVYGNDSNWTMQIRNVTNSQPPFRLWYGKRDLAECAAKEWVQDSESWEIICFG